MPDCQYQVRIWLAESRTYELDEAGNVKLRQCRNPAILGSDPPVCWRHSGKAGRARATEVKQERKLMRKVRDLLQDFEIDDQHPLDGLLEAVKYAGGMVRSLRDLVTALEVDPKLVMTDDGFWTMASGIYGPDHTGDASPHVLVQLYGLWLDRYARACKLALDANIDERLVRSAESTGHEFLDAWTRALARVDLTPELRGRLSRALAEELRALTGSTDPGNAGRVIETREVGDDRE